tara:strand:+ start:180 stop:1013 length:834 start_codon:yes stop_codon:yes gene_type:complete
MKLQTAKLKAEVNTFEDSLERLQVLKDQYKGETAYIVAGGPSLNKYSKDYLKEFMSDKLCMPIKQSYSFLKEVSDFHLLNFCNFSPYDWSDNKSIITWALFEQFHPQMIFENNIAHDLFIPIFRNNPATGGGEQGPNKMLYSLAEKEDWDTMKLDNPEYSFNQPWGPGIMYELAIPLAIYLGCSKIVTVGWDIGDLSTFKVQTGPELHTQPAVFQDHFYGEEHNNIVYQKTKMRPREIISVAKATKGIYYWLKEQGIDWEIVSDTNPGYEGIKRIEL